MKGSASDNMRAVSAIETCSVSLSIDFTRGARASAKGRSPYSSCAAVAKDRLLLWFRTDELRDLGSELGDAASRSGGGCMHRGMRRRSFGQRFQGAAPDRFQLLCRAFVRFGQNDLVVHRCFIKKVHGLDIGRFQSVAGIDEDKNAPEARPAPEIIPDEALPAFHCRFFGARIAVARQIDDRQLSLRCQEVIDLPCTPRAVRD